MLRVRKNILDMSAYHPPLANRADLLRLDFNENVEGPSPSVAEALRSARPETLSIYPDDAAATRAAAGYFQVPEDNLILTNGADEAIQCLVNLLVNPGDFAPVFEPTYAMYRIYLGIAGAAIETVLYNADFSFPYDTLESLLARRPNLIFLGSPNNPTGTEIDARILDIAARHPGTAFVLDEAYADFSGVSRIGEALRRDNLLVLRTFSKAFGLAGLRIGAILGKADTIALLRKIRSPYSISNLSLTLLQAALRDTASMDAYRKRVAEGKAFVLPELQRRGVRAHPSNANFILIEAGAGVRDLVAGMARQGVLVRSRDSDPLLKGWFRLTVGPRPAMERFLTAFDAARGSA